MPKQITGLQIMVANYSGNVGKTTIVDNCFLPRLPNLKAVAIESINSNGRAKKDNKKGRDFDRITTALGALDSDVNTLVDVGSSNAEKVFDLMRENGSAEDFDYFIIPVMPDSKMFKDTVEIIKDLSDMGVPPEKIIVLFNKAQRDETLDYEFGAICAFHETFGLFTLNESAVIYKSDLYNDMKAANTTIPKLLADQRDLNELMAKSKTQEERNEFSMQRSMRRRAINAEKNMTEVFTAIFG